MPKFEKPQKGNPHRLAVSQHVFPSKSIARFAGSDGRVHLHTRQGNLIRRAKPTDSIFCVTRAWDNGSEVGFIKKLEDDFQRLAESILEGRVSSFDGERTHIISSFYVLWMARAEIRHQPEQDIALKGILPGRKWSKDDEEQLEKAGFTFFRGTAVPGRILNGMRLRMQVTRYLRQVNPTACWGIIRASSGEFLAPDWPVHAFIPINPTLALANPAINQTLNRESVGGQQTTKISEQTVLFRERFCGMPVVIHKVVEPRD
jgi:hypothetical protein